MQKIPSELLENIVKLILSNQIKNPIFYRNLIKCISLAIKFGNNTPAKLYEDIESYFQKVTDIEQRYDLLSIIDSAVLR